MPATVDVDADNALIRVLLTPEGRADPYPIYRELRELAPVLRSSFGVLVLARYDDCMSALRDPHLGRGAALRSDADTPLGLGAFGGDSVERREFFASAGANMLFADPPEHTRLRAVVSRSFTPRRVLELRPSVEQMVEELLDRLVGAGDVDWMETLAFPLPVRVIGELLGVPEADRAGFQPLIRSAVSALDPSADAETARTASAAMREANDYFVDLVAERRRHPTDDLLSALVERTGDAAEDLTNEEVVATALLLFAAGFETTTNLLGNGLLALLNEPEQLRRWRLDRSLGPSAVEELLRWDSPVQLNMRTALRPATIAGEELAPGDVVLILQGSANRDPGRFDEPERLDVARPNNAPLSFGWGIHHCLGAGLARMEGEVVFDALLSSCTSVEPRFDEPEWRPTITLRGVASLPVCLTS